MKPKIVVTQELDLLPDQKKRLEKIGDVTYYKTLAKNGDEWLKRCKNKNIILSGKHGLKEKIYNLNDTFISLPFVGTSWIDLKKIETKKINISNSPGCNKEAVSEWIIVMMINLMREIPSKINTKIITKDNIKPGVGVSEKKITILGAGNVGKRVGKMCDALGMKVTFFRRGQNIHQKTKSADVVVDCLGSNNTTKGILNKKFFMNLKKGSYFITVTGPEICDTKSVIEALNKGILAGVAHDSGGIKVGDTKDPFYIKLKKHPKILATPHIAFYTDTTNRTSNDIMIDNVESWIKEKPKNLIK